MKWNTLANALKNGNPITISGTFSFGTTITGRVLAIQAEGGKNCWIVTIHDAKQGNCGKAETIFVRTID